MVRWYLIIITVIIYAPVMYGTYGEYLTDSDSLLQSFCAPINFTRSGMHTFISNRFNRPEYAREFLPHNLSHCIQFFQYGKSSKQNLAYMQAAFRLFTNKIKAAPYISAGALQKLLEELPTAIEEHCAIRQRNWLENLSVNLKQLLYNSFLQKFSLFKQDPDTFFNDLTSQMTNAIQHEPILQESITQETFRNQIIRFMELACSKALWTPFEQDDAWGSFKALSENLIVYADKGIINDDELDDLSHSLLERFVYFLDLTGSELSLNAIEAMKNDLNMGNVVLCAIGEQEECLSSKYQRLSNALIETEAKIMARKRGIITEVLPLSGK
jgi:hypothetical protein